MIVIMIQIGKHRPLQRNDKPTTFQSELRKLTAEDGDHSDPVQVDVVVITRATEVVF